MNFPLEDQRHPGSWVSSSSYAMLFYDLNVVNPKAYGFDFSLNVHKFRNEGNREDSCRWRFEFLFFKSRGIFLVSNARQRLAGSALLSLPPGLVSVTVNWPLLSLCGTHIVCSDFLLFVNRAPAIK